MEGYNTSFIELLGDVGMVVAEWEVHRNSDGSLESAQLPRSGPGSLHSLQKEWFDKLFQKEFGSYTVFLHLSAFKNAMEEFDEETLEIFKDDAIET